MIIFYLLLWWHFPVLIVILMFVSGLICYLFPRFPSFIIMLLNVLMGFVYSIIINAEALSFLIVCVTVIFTLIPILLVKYTIHLKRKADEMYNSDDL
ncbi:hypothetical protein MTP04_14980 [Lysinibacillus sp. PLM2]|nr:hypothetical protein MTP04_14980 [Lysinibacillus sp. PLM2]